MDYVPQIDEETVPAGRVVRAGDEDTNNHAKGYNGMGEGYSYPMLKTFTLGINLSF